ncbi:CEN-like protein 1 [Triangularia verruculosa]|uniref:CEN-like protein 1 n=1 Tax=Triangularia verruculosa TaxID=2587418 RepID=A0AAN7AW98_9PEZI|nr:CEN-like protein 1 [Triangularia verruculosa]
MSKYLPLLALTSAPLALARTPPGFIPSTSNDLIVEYTGFYPSNGVVVSREITIPQPRIATTTPLNGTSYSILMIDLDIPTNNPPETNTLLHWLQTSLTPSTQSTTFNTTSGSVRGFQLLNTTQTTPVVGYFGPNPPARIPLSHRYVQILVDTSNITEQGEAALREAAATLRGFNAESVLEEAGLEGNVVAGNWYNVTNPGSVVNATATTAGTMTVTPTATGAGTGGIRGSLMGAVVGLGVVMVVI